MAESVEPTDQAEIYTLKSNRSGNLKLENGRLVIDTGTNVYNETLYATDTMTGAEVGRGTGDVLKYATASFSTATGDLRLSNGNLTVTGYTGTVNLQDVSP